MSKFNEKRKSFPDSFRNHLPVKSKNIFDPSLPKALKVHPTFILGPGKTNSSVTPMLILRE